LVICSFTLHKDCCQTITDIISGEMELLADFLSRWQLLPSWILNINASDTTRARRQ
jgi:hypothetical protein